MKLCHINRSGPVILRPTVLGYVKLLTPLYTNRQRGDVCCAVVVHVRSVDRVVLEPLDVRLQVAQYPAVEADRFSLVDCLIAGTSKYDRRMRQTRYNVNDVTNPFSAFIRKKNNNSRTLASSLILRLSNDRNIQLFVKG